MVEAGGFDLGDDGDKLALAGAAFLDGVRGGRLQGERGLWPTGMSSPYLEHQLRVVRSLGRKS